MVKKIKHRQPKEQKMTQYEAQIQFLTKLTCGHCIAYNSVNDRQGFCRRHPPQIVVIGASQHEPTIATPHQQKQVNSIDLRAIFPPVGASDPACMDCIPFPREEGEA